MKAPFLERYRERIAGVLTCYDWIVIAGTLPSACYADGMASFLNAKHIRIFDYPCLAQLLRDRIRAAAEKLATAAGAKVEFIGKTRIRKEDVVAAVSKSRGDYPGGWCMSFRPWKPARPTGPGET